MSGTLAPTPKFTGFDNNGAIIPGGKLFTYTAGTTTKVSTYTDVGLTTANSNPIILDSAGRATIFLSPGSSYKFVLSPSTDTDPPTAPIWTQDNIAAAPLNTVNVDITGTAGGTIVVGNAVYLSDGSGGRTAGKWYVGDSANNYTSSTANQVGFALNSANANDALDIRQGGQVTGLVGLSSGSVYYIGTSGALTSTPPAFARPIAQADSTTSVVISPWVVGAQNSYAPKIAEAKEFTDAVTFDSTTQTVGQAQFTIPAKFQPGTSTGTYVPVIGTLFSSGVPVDSTTAASSLLMTATLPANTLAAVGNYVKLTATLTVVNNANAKSIFLNLNGSALGTAWAAGANKAYIVQALFILTKTGSNTQRICGYILGSDTAGTAINIYQSYDGTQTLTDTGSLTIGMMCVATGTAADVSQRMMVVEVG